MPDKVFRLTEWSRCPLPLSEGTRDDIAGSVERWKDANNLPRLPVSFSGAKGEILETSHYVGVIEAGGCTLEIYPKLDRSLIDSDGMIEDSNRCKSTMASLLWMLETAQHQDLLDADTGSLETEPTSFLDLWAMLLAKNLHREMERGLARAYRPHEDTIRTVRGRILFQEQLTRNFNRPDRIHCTWDEFTEDRPLNRILKCTCRFLSTRVQNNDTRRLLLNCIALLDEVEDIDIPAALRQVDRVVWDRSMQRFHLPFKLAVRLLQSIGHQTFHGGPQAYVFLLDMNKVFEDYVGAILERAHGVPVSSQHCIGHLFQGPYGIRQLPDFHWQKEGKVFVADAKYKLFFLPDNGDPLSEAKGQGFDLNDVRQLVCYGLMAFPNPEQVELQLIYPFVGNGPLPAPITKITFTGMPLTAIPIHTRKHNVGWGELLHA